MIVDVVVDVVSEIIVLEIEFISCFLIGLGRNLMITSTKKMDHKFSLQSLWTIYKTGFIGIRQYIDFHLVFAQFL
jgi:hypothetical protein